MNMASLHLLAELDEIIGCKELKDKSFLEELLKRCETLVKKLRLSK